MTKKQRDDVRAGQVWRDRDKRSFSGDRRVRVTATGFDGRGAYVLYQQCIGTENDVCGGEFRSKYELFQRRFDLLTVGAQ